MHIVVARYNEDAKWTRTMTNISSNVIIYNKGAPLGKEYHEIPLENVGREGHTYYKYIYDNYDNLEDYTIFLQGNPFDHSPNILSNLEYLFQIKDKLDFDFKFLSETLNNCSLEECHFSLKPLPLREVYGKLFGERTDKFPFIFGGGGQFIVSKDAIRKRSREFYMKIVEMLQNEIDPIEGYVIERFHPLIFNGMYSC
jgi:hypothetical protein